MASKIKDALPAHMKPSNGAEGAERHHGKSQSHVVSAVFRSGHGSRSRTERVEDTSTSNEQPSRNGISSTFITSQLSARLGRAPQREWQNRPRGSPELLDIAGDRDFDSKVLVTPGCHLSSVAPSATLACSARGTAWHCVCRQQQSLADFTRQHLAQHQKTMTLTMTRKLIFLRMTAFDGLAALDLCFLLLPCCPASWLERLGAC